MGNKTKKRKLRVSDYLIWGPIYYFFMTMLVIGGLPFIVLSVIFDRKQG